MRSTYTHTHEWCEGATEHWKQNNLQTDKARKGSPEKEEAKLSLG